MSCFIYGTHHRLEAGSSIIFDNQKYNLLLLDNIPVCYHPIWIPNSVILRDLFILYGREAVSDAWESVVCIGGCKDRVVLNISEVTLVLRVIFNKHKIDYGESAPIRPQFETETYYLEVIPPNIKFYRHEHCTLHNVVKLLQERYLEAASLFGGVQ
ncbi:MAG: hypothetical protein M0Q12_09445, partial [Synergistaceae bacterium]|jgi:hypothetical protein|nr:hypothetical protein [Synergistaceae bacterium]